MVPTANLNPKIAILIGPTATGKSNLAIEIASQRTDIEIINADSLLVYRGMDIGTAKPTSQDLSRIPHHLIDICDPQETFTAGEFRRAAETKIQEITSRGNQV